MTLLISGSMAIDTVMSCPFPFALDSQQVDTQRLAISFYMPQMNHVWGGCAGNIAYAVKQLGGKPIVLATMGHDATDYLSYFHTQGIDTSYIQVLPEQLTAKAVIMNDSLGQQITGFHPGAMNEAHTQTANLAIDQQHPNWAIVSPDGKQAMLERSSELAARKIPFIADPGQAMPIMSKIDLNTLMHGANVIAVNETEAQLLETTLEYSIEQLSYTLPVLVTLGDQGCSFWQQGKVHTIKALNNIKAVDPTGCGDSLRGAWLHALSLGWSMLDGLRLGNLMGGYKVQYAGAQGYNVSMVELRELWITHYGIEVVFPG
jgi:adenosine kinase